jgi:hypothetical protein
VTRALRVFGRLMHGHESPYAEQLRHSLRRDGYVTDPDSGHIMSAGPMFAAGTLAGLKDASAIREQLDASRARSLAMGSAKELIESTAKAVLAERGLPVSDKADLPELVRQAQQAFGLHLGAPLRLHRTAPTRSSASSAESPPSPPTSPSCATAATAPVTDPREHVSACGPTWWR